MLKTAVPMSSDLEGKQNEQSSAELATLTCSTQEELSCRLNPAEGPAVDHLIPYTTAVPV